MRPKRGSKPFVAMSFVADTSVAIFAGGKSSRFGSPKINAKINETEFGSLIIKALKRAGFTDIALIGGDVEDSLRWGVDFIQDDYPESGPVGALLTAMKVCKTELLMTLPCDVPYIDEDTCRQLSKRGIGFDVRVARTDSAQWLCSTWRRSTCDAIEREFVSGERAIHEVIEKLNFEFVDLSSQALANINESHQLKHQPKST